jgi:hypothetical protein
MPDHLQPSGPLAAFNHPAARRFGTLAKALLSAYIAAMENFNFNAPAELFPSRNRKVVSKLKYRRFDKAAEAIRFAVEELPEPLLLGAYIQLDEQRLGHREIRALYDAKAFPLKRKQAA